MASTYSTNLRLELIGTGEQQGTWGGTTNTNLGTLIEQAITGYASVAVTNGADTTLTTSNGASDQARNMTLNLTGTLSAVRNVICPSTPKIYLVKNSTTGGFAVNFKVSGQTGVSIPSGQVVLVYVDGTDVRPAYGPNLFIGSGDNTASAVTGSIFSANKTGTNVIGGDLSIYAGNGTGTGGSGNVKIYTAAGESSGTTPNTLTERIRIDGAGLSILRNSNGSPASLSVTNSNANSASYSLVTVSTGSGVNSQWYAYGSEARIGTFSDHPFIISSNSTIRLYITPAGGFSFGASSANYGASGQYLVSNGNSPPSWQNITTSDALNATANASVGAVGTFAFLSSTITSNAGDTVTSSQLYYTGAGGSRVFGQPSGTWRSMGGSGGGTGAGSATLFLRIS